MKSWHFTTQVFAEHKEIIMIKDVSVNESSLFITIETGDLLVIPIKSAHAVETACCRRNLIYCADEGVVDKLRVIAERNIPKEAIISYFQG